MILCHDLVLQGFVVRGLVLRRLVFVDVGALVNVQLIVMSLSLQTIISLHGVFPGSGRGAALRSVTEGFPWCPSRISSVDPVFMFVSPFFKNLANLRQLRRIQDGGIFSF